MMAVRIQQKAPDFRCGAVISGDFKEVSLSDYKGKYLVMFFYPLDFTFVCPTEIISFSDRLDEFRKINADVVAASIDSKYTHLAWLNTPRKDGGIQGVRYPIMADVTKQVARDYGVLIEEGKDAGVALRGLFVIDPNQNVRHMVVNDLPIGRSVDEALRVVQALQYHAEHGEVCPANWKPGAETMKPDPKGSKMYFNKVNQ